MTTFQIVALILLATCIPVTIVRFVQCSDRRFNSQCEAERQQRLAEQASVAEATDSAIDETTEALA